MFIEPNNNSKTGWIEVVDGGAFLNDVKIACNDPVALNRALLSSGFAYDVKNRIEQLKIVNVLLPQIRDLRRIGSAAADICHVATGLVDGYFETGLIPVLVPPKPGVLADDAVA